eukprot:6184629-Pleurochrysis_carterae.AAC.1
MWAIAKGRGAPETRRASGGVRRPRGGVKAARVRGRRSARARARAAHCLHLVELLAQDGNVVAERADRVLAADAQVVVQPAVDVVHAEELTCASARGRAQARGWAQDEWTGRRLAARMRVCNRAWQHQTCTGRCGLERSESRYENRRADLVRASLLGVISKE